MVASRWKSFGASVRGPGHARMCMPNQDYYIVASCIWGDVIVVSDGVGSCPTSEWGSAAACRAVLSVARSWSEKEGVGALVERIQSTWLERVKPFEPNKSSATCLFAIRPQTGQITLGMLGDGLIVALKTDNSCLELTEDKEDAFSNQTEALTANTHFNQWRTAFVSQKECCALLLCTDGIADDLLPDKRQAFARHIYEQGQRFAAVTVAREVRKMLEEWPVPHHSDDKTLVCLYKCEEDA